MVDGRRRTLQRTAAGALKPSAASPSATSHQNRRRWFRTRRPPQSDAPTPLYRDTWFMPSSRSFTIRLIEGRRGEYVYTEERLGHLRRRRPRRGLPAGQLGRRLAQRGSVTNTLCGTDGPEPEIRRHPGRPQTAWSSTTTAAKPGRRSDFWESGVIRPDLKSARPEPDPRRASLPKRENSTTTNVWNNKHPARNVRTPHRHTFTVLSLLTAALFHGPTCGWSARSQWPCATSGPLYRAVRATRRARHHPQNPPAQSRHGVSPARGLAASGLQMVTLSPQSARRSLRAGHQFGAGPGVALFLWAHPRWASRRNFVRPIARHRGRGVARRIPRAVDRRMGRQLPHQRHHGDPDPRHDVRFGRQLHGRNPPVPFERSGASNRSLI